MDHEANGAVLDEQSPSQPPPSQSPGPSRRGLGSLFFSGSQPTEEDWEMAAVLEEEATSRLLDGDGSGSGDGWTSDPDESLPGTSSPESSGDGGGPLKPLSKAALRATTRKGVLIATSMAHRVAARTELQRAAGIYIADDQDQELIGDPVANLLHRRGGLAGGKMSEDANDALSALMGLANYIGKQVALTVEIQRLEASGPQPVPGEVA